MICFVLMIEESRDQYSSLHPWVKLGPTLISLGLENCLIQQQEWNEHPGGVSSDNPKSLAGTHFYGCHCRVERHASSVDTWHFESVWLVDENYDAQWPPTPRWNAVGPTSRPWAAPKAIHLHSANSQSESDPPKVEPHSNWLGVKDDGDRTRSWNSAEKPHPWPPRPPRPLQYRITETDVAQCPSAWRWVIGMDWLWRAHRPGWWWWLDRDWPGMIVWTCDCVDYNADLNRSVHGCYCSDCIRSHWKSVDAGSVDFHVGDGGRWIPRGPRQPTSDFDVSPCWT